MSTTIIEALFDYFDVCPLMTENRLNIDYLPEDTGQAGVEYALAPVPVDKIIQRYIDGGARCRYVFIISSVNDYGADELQNIANSGFMEKLATWIQKQSRSRNLPKLPIGMTALGLGDVSSSYLHQASASTAKYQMQCELIYYEKGEL